MTSQITNYTCYLQYFADLAYADPELQVDELGRSIIVFESFHKLGEARSERRYPVLEVERPSGRINAPEGGRHFKLWTAGFSVLDHAPKDDDAQQQEVLGKTEAIVDRLISHLLADQVVERDTLSITPVINVQGDSLFGWSVSFEMKLTANYCFQPGSWLPFYRLQPIYGGAPGTLSLTLNGEAYEIDWQTQADTRKVLLSLAKIIMASDETVNAYVDSGCLMLIAKSLEQAVSLSLPAAGGISLPAVFPLTFGSQQHHWKLIHLHGAY